MAHKLESIVIFFPCFIFLNIFNNIKYEVMHFSIVSTLILDNIR